MTESKEQGLSGSLLAAEPQQIAALIDYQEESIVSRTLLKRNVGSVTLFAFATGQALSEHTAPFDAIVQIIEGEAELTIGGQKVCVEMGQIVLMPADIPHGVYAPQPFKMLLTMIREQVP